MNSMKSGVRSRIAALQTELGRHGEPLLDRPIAPVVNPRRIGLMKRSLGRDSNDPVHGFSVPRRGSPAAGTADLDVLGELPEGEVVDGRVWPLHQRRVTTEL